jgi:hypothetical protein
MMKKGGEKMKEKKGLNAKQDIMGWGFGLVIMGILHFFIPALAEVWGVVLVAMGILCLAVQHRGVYIMIGIGLMVIGLLNLVAGVEFGGKFWAIYGAFQIYWGIKELIKFGKCRKIEIQETPEELELLKEETA